METHSTELEAPLTVYNTESKLTFGKHKGKTLAQVFNKAPSYLVWCQANIEGFYIDDATLASFRFQRPSFQFSPEAAAKHQALRAWKNYGELGRRISKMGLNDCIEYVDCTPMASLA